ncbi:HAD family hydrolase [Terrisporobacter sp.]|uniref:HAD family hydrolase n=1 Tax=Terrisporobacter sp. TaxID=1965305 RepID=UPI00260BB803|nr:HAD family hydrolase [Terrisporobacter sp.]
MSYNTLIFDLDGTLLNTLDDLTNSVNYALHKLNFPTRSSEEICSFVGNGVEKLIELSVPEKTSYDQFAKCLLIFKKHYSENMRNETRPYDGIIGLLEYLKKNNYNMAIVSNKFQEGVTDLNNHYFSDYIDVAIGKSPEMRKKPYPDTVLAAIDKLGASKENCLYIGDSEVDIKTAQNANIKSVGVAWGFRGKSLLQKLGANYVIDTPQDLISII